MDKVLILGANSDIAKACAIKFAERGHDLILASRTPVEVQDERLQLSQVNIEVKIFDAVNFTTHEDFYASVKGRFQIVLIAFGYLGDQETAMDTFEESQKVIEANFMGVVSIVNLIARGFEQQGVGTILGISSVAGERGKASNYIYGSAKAGLTTYFSGLRNHLFKFGVHVCTVKPGFSRTKMTAHLDLPGALTSTPEQVAESIYKNGFVKKRNVIYTLPIWRYIMLIIRNIPEFIFKRMNLK